MHFHVRHTTTYRYSAPAILGPHTIRLRPQATPGLRVTRWSLQVQPHPVGSAEVLDDAGNLVQTIWFAGATSVLTIVTSFEAQVAILNPFDFVVTDPTVLTLPARYTSPNLIAPYLKPVQQSGTVARLSSKLARLANGSTIEFLRLATEHLGTFQKTIREEGLPQRPSETLASRTGACRDLTVLLMDLCRWQGLAARFVSGYWRVLRTSDRRYLHAWAEVYLPGAGWRGFDPSSGFAVGDDHLPVAAAPDPESTAPVTGTYGGGNLQSKMEWQLRIDVKM